VLQKHAANELAAAACCSVLSILLEEIPRLDSRPVNAVVLAASAANKQVLCTYGACEIVVAALRRQVVEKVYI